MSSKRVSTKPYEASRPQSLRRPLKKAVKRLKMTGLDAKMFIEEDRGFIIIPFSEIVKLIDRKIVYKNHKVYVGDNKIIVEVWRE